MAREALLVFVTVLLVGVVGATSHDLTHIMERLEAAEAELGVLRQHCATQASDPLVFAAPSITLATPEVNVPGEIRFGDNSTLSSASAKGILGGGYSFTDQFGTSNCFPFGTACCSGGSYYGTVSCPTGSLTALLLSYTDANGWLYQSSLCLSP